MYCKKCGNELSEKDKFCPKCGAAQEVTTALPFEPPVNQAAPPSSPNISFAKPKPNVNATAANTAKHPHVKKEMTKKRRSGIIAGLVLSIILIIGIILAVIFFSGSAFKVYKDLETGDYSDAISTYEVEVKDSPLQNMFANSLLKSYAEDVFTDFTKEKLEFEQACKILETLQQMGFKNAKEVYDRVVAENQSNISYEQGITYYENGDYENAIKELSKIADGNSNYSDAQEKLKALYPQYVSSVSEKAKSFAESGDYVEALSLISFALDILPKDGIDTSELTSTKDAYANSYKQQVMSESTNLLSAQKYAEAIEMANTALEVLSDDPEIKSLQSSCSSQYENYVINQIDQLTETYKFSEAEKLLNEALEILPDNTQLTAKKAELETKKPTSLASQTLINNDGWNWNQGSPSDPFGNDYSNASNYCIVINAWGAQVHYGEFRIYKKFSKLTGTLSPYTDMGENDAGYIQIYGDDNLLYTSPNITRKTDAFSINVDISNVDYLKIVVNGNYAKIILSDLMLYP